jgi:hypothetical protein
MPQKFVINKKNVSQSARIKGRMINSEVFTKSLKGEAQEFTKNQIKKRFEEFIEKNRKEKKNIMVMFSVDTDVGYRSAKSFHVNDSPIYVENYKWDISPSFAIFYWETDKKPKSGGNDENNDCLYNAITKIVTKFYLSSKIKEPDVLKTFLRLDRNDKISFDLLGEVEQLLNVNIYVSGDHTYKPKNKKNYRKNVHLTLLDGHYDIDKDYYREYKNELLSGVGFKEKELIVYNILENDVLCCSGYDEYLMTVDEFKAAKNLSYKGEEAYMENDKYAEEEKNGKKYKRRFTLQEFYQFLLREAEILKELSHDTIYNIDLKRSGYNFKKESLKLSLKCFKDFDHPDPIKLNEQNWLINTMMGALIFCNAGSYTNAYDYDVRSAYPSVMTDEYFRFPIKEGVFEKITKFPVNEKGELYAFCGIYRCNIERSGDEDIDKLFRFNRKEYYTHYDITTAVFLKLKISLIIDEQPNALLYLAKDQLYGRKVFLGLFQNMYNMKGHSVLSKAILNSVWGQLCSKKKIKRLDNFDIDDDLVEINELRVIGSKIKVSYTKKTDYYCFNYARIGCFLTSKVRQKMAMDMYKNRQNIVHCHTDGFLSLVEIPELPIGTDLGWKYKVNHANLKAVNPSVKLKEFKNT